MKYKKAIDLKPNDAEMRDIFGDELIIVGRIRDAIDSYNEAIDINQKDWVAYQGLASAFKASLQYGLATLHYKKVTEIDPRASFSQTELVCLLAEAGRPKQVKAKYDRASELKVPSKQCLN